MNYNRLFALRSAAADLSVRLGASILNGAHLLVSSLAKNGHGSKPGIFCQYLIHSYRFISTASIFCIEELYTCLKVTYLHLNLFQKAIPTR